MEDKISQNLNNFLDSEDIKEKKQLPAELEGIIQFIPEDKREEAKRIYRSLSIETQSSFTGPLPPPSLLKGYNDVITNGAERIIKMTENQSLHRIELEKHTIREELRQSSRGQIFGFILALTGMGIALLLAYLGHEATAGVFGTTTIVGLVTVFVIGKKNQAKNSE